MSALQVVNINEFKGEHVKLSKLRDNKSGMGKSANFTYNDNRFNIAILNTTFPFGASAKPEKFRQGDKDQWSIQCNLTKEQIHSLKEFDEQVIDMCLENPDVLNALQIKKSNREVLESKYFPIQINTEYDPTIRCGIIRVMDLRLNFSVQLMEGHQLLNQITLV